MWERSASAPVCSGGVFVLLKRKPGSKSVYLAQIFDESGAYAYNGSLALEPASAAPIDVTSVDEFVGWDGEQLLLTEGRALVRPPR